MNSPAQETDAGNAWPALEILIQAV
jgi:hypothetical protein